VVSDSSAERAIAGSTTGPATAWAGTVSGAAMSSREQAAVAQAMRLPREVRCTISLSDELRTRNAPLEREDDALSALIEKLDASHVQGPDLRIGQAVCGARVQRNY
jgi:ethanolamine ammonia-lyase large subunit